MKCATTILSFLFSLSTALASGGAPAVPFSSYPLSIDTVALDTTICAGDSVRLQLPQPGATSIQWEPAFLLSCSDCPNPVTEPLFGDQFFTVTGLDAQGAPFSYEFNVYIRHYLDFGLLLFTNSPVCEGDTLVFDPHVGGGQSYAWTGPNQEVFSTAPYPILPDITPAEAGTYSLALVDELGCEAGASFDVQVHPSFTASISTTDATCNGICDGAAILDISGGAPPYQITWDEGLNWSAGASLTGLCPGTYPFWVMDENCTQELEVVIGEGDPLSASMNIGPPACPGGDIIIEIFNFSGGAGSGEQYLYSVDGGLTFQPTFDVQWQIPAATTSIIVADDAGCQVTYPIDVAIPQPIRADVSVANASCISQDDGSISVENISGGTPPYDYYLNAPPSTPLENLAPGEYLLIIEDANGCTAEFRATISLSPIDAITNDTLICAGEQVLLQARAPGAVSVQWSPAAGLSAPGQLTTLATPAESATYTITVEDSEGCTGADSVQVAILSGPCREEWRDTLAIGQSGQWCSVASMFGSPIPYGITELGCGQGLIAAGIAPLATCLDYTAVQPGEDTLCVTICELLDTAQCWEAFLYLTVTEQLVWPGDTDSSGLADNYDLLNIGLAYNSTGPLRPNASIAWQGQPAPLWQQYTPASGINYRHIDTDGDGRVSSADTLALSQNWGFTRTDGNERPGANAGQPATPLNAPFYLQPDTLIAGATMRLPLILGTENAPVTGIYGLAFSIYFDESVVKDSTAALVLADSWLGAPSQNLIYMQRRDDPAGRIDVGITRIDGVDAGGFGPIGEMFITIEDDILARNRGLGPEARFEIREVRIINFREEPFSVDTPPTDYPVITGLKAPFLPSRLRISPNPAAGHFYLYCPDIPLDQVKLVNALGQPVRTWARPESGEQLSLLGIAPGLYLVKVRAGTGIGALWLVVE